VLGANFSIIGKRVAIDIDLKIEILLRMLAGEKGERAFYPDREKRTGRICCALLFA
jgi:hypothetical protein